MQFNLTDEQHLARQVLLVEETLGEGTRVIIDTDDALGRRRLLARQMVCEAVWRQLHGCRAST